MRLEELLLGVEPVEVLGSVHREVDAIHFDSRKVSNGDLFFAVPGTSTDGHRFIPQVLDQGAGVIVCEHRPQASFGDATVVVVRSSARALGIMANNFYGRPSEKMTLVGVTGTNGKTTTATLLYRLFRQLHGTAGLLSTIRNFAGDEIIPSTHTTGDAIQIASLMAKMVAAGCTHCFMEVTSHAIHQHRITGLEFDGAVFTNLSHDHLDYHGTLEVYRDVKKSFFDSLPDDAFALTNVDDPVGMYMVDSSPARRVTYGQLAQADFQFSITEGIRHEIELRIDGFSVKSQLVGTFNAYNLAAVFGCAVLLGEQPKQVAGILASLAPVEGRMERVDGPEGKMAVVDFAHTPDALAKALATLRETAGQRSLTCVFGCGGDRDREKRPLMGKIAAELADAVILTNDNPRSENPEMILAQIRTGIPESYASKVQIVQDRQAAIVRACNMAPAGGIILVAGKGHEKYQEIAGERVPFDDVEVARSALA